MEKKKINKKVILGSGLGTIMEWYDFYLYGVLTVFFSFLFFPKGSELTAVLVSLATFGAGFAVRPLGALFFGSLGDRFGRKSAFLITIVIMGISTAGIGVLPTYSEIGYVAPILLVLLRIVQGFALGGEYAGALLYVAEHNPKTRLGLVTSFIQSTATIGLALALGMIMLTRSALTEQDFLMWGWRLPFLFSIVLLSLSIYIRAGLKESPVFLNMKMRGLLEKNPLRKSFSGQNLKKMLILLLGLLSAQAVIWYTGHFYVWYYLQSILNLSMPQAFDMFIYPLICSIPMFIFFGWLSDKIGPIKISVAAIVLAMLSYYFVFGAMVSAVNPNIEQALLNKQVSLMRYEECLKDCVQAQMFLNKNHINFNLEKVAKTEKLMDSKDFKSAKTTTGTNVATGSVTANSATANTSSNSSIILNATNNASNLTNATNASMVLKIQDKKYPLFGSSQMIEDTISDALIKHGLIAQKEINSFLLQGMIWYLIVLVGMVYVPMASILIRSFPSNVSYTSISFIYHAANGWFGGFLPLISTYLLTQHQNVYAGLVYPIGVCAVGLVISAIFVRNTKLYESKWQVESSDLDKQTKYDD